MDRYNTSKEVRNKYEELTRVDDNVYEEPKIIDDNLDNCNIEELKTLRDEIDAKIIELRNEERLTNNLIINLCVWR